MSSLNNIKWYLKQDFLEVIHKAIWGSVAWRHFSTLSMGFDKFWYVGSLE